MKRMLRGATALAIVAGFLHPAFAAAHSRPLVTTQPDPSADVAPYFVADTDPRWSDARVVQAGHRDAAAEGQIRVRDLQREPLVRPRIRHVPGRQRPLFRWQKSALARRHARLHSDLCRHKYGRDRHRSAVSRRPGAELDIQGLDRPFAPRPRRQDRRQERRSARWTSSRLSSGIVTRARAAPKARRWASSSRASSWRISTATPSRSSGATPAASRSSTTSSPPKTRPRRRTPSP